MLLSTPGHRAETLLKKKVAEMPILLTVTAGPHAGSTFRFDRHDTFLVGREPEAHVSLPDDGYLSRMHFLIEVNPPRCRLTDLTSRNGTLVNGQKVQSTDLQHGDEIKAGRTVLKVAVTTEAAAGTLDLPPDEKQEPSTATDKRLVADLVNEYRQRRQKGENPDPAEYTRCHPRIAAAIQEALAAEQTGGGDNLSTMRPPGPPLPCLIGYQLLAELGKGGMGVVYRARRERDGVEVAVKTIRPAVTLGTQVVTRFLREAGILEQLRHPNIVAFHESGLAGGLLFFVMELVPGTNAAELILAHGALEVRRAVRLTLDMLAALEYAHGRSFIHRDIKPANLLVTNTPEGDRGKLADFGLARTYQESPLSGLTLSGTAAGTPHFMPPEQITDFRGVRPAADQYSAAATLYYLLTGQYAYDGASPSEVFRKKLTEEPVPLVSRRQDVPADLAAVVHRALSRRPEERFADVSAFIRALRPWG
jgi:serine/threonine-protein kinase